ncbi:MAG TPA: insulinase family protein [Opitutaceae bacterium]|nr:insulinase family protein [Opitutaceae bacterium]
MSFPFRPAFCGWLFAAIAIAAAAAPWPAVESDLTPDPAVRWGTLPNGLRYAILPNAEPKGRVSLRLLVSVGSLHERDDERGLAHFIEHMAFRGTRTHPAGSIVTALQRLGIGMGPDNTAFTSHNYTIYHLELPDTGETSLRDALKVFREYADGITFETEQIERERGVIVSEKDTRNTPFARAGEAAMAFLWPDSLQVRRSPIGREEAVRTFTREQFVSFYDAWYRPERMAVLVVGDLAVEPAEAAIQQEFATLAARGPARPEPEAIVPSSVAPPNIRVFVDPGLVGLNLALQRPLHVPRTADTHASRVRELHQALAFGMFRQRLDAAAHRPGSSFLAPHAGISFPILEWQVAEAGVSGKIDNWQAAARELEQEHRRALFFGFTASELATAKAMFQTIHDQSVRSAATRSSQGLAGQLATTLLTGEVFASPATIQADVARELAATTLEECRIAFRMAWGNGSTHVLASANPVFNITPVELAAVLNTSRNTEVQPPADAGEIKFAYTDFGPASPLVRENHVPDLDVRLAEFANGVRLNHKETTFEADFVEVHVRVGLGQLSQPPNKPGLDLLAEAALMQGGLLKHSAQDVKTLLASRAVSVAFRVESDAFEFSGHCARRELVLCLQLITAYLNEAAYRSESLVEAQGWFNSMLASLAASPGGPIRMSAPREIVGGDRRFGIANAPEFYANDLRTLARWLDEGFDRAPIELSIVGDVPWSEAAGAVGKTLGALPKRKPRVESLRNSAVSFVSPPAETQVYGTDPSLKQAALAWYWPVPDLADNVQQERRCHFLAGVVGERLRAKLREELGAAYAPTADFVATDGFPEYNYFLVYAEVEPSRAQQTAQILKREATALRTEGITEDEFLRAREPFLNQWRSHLRTNGYWGHTVLRDAQQRPQRLVSARNRATDTAAITREEIQSLAHRHLDPARGFFFVAEPAPAHFWGRK